MLWISAALVSGDGAMTITARSDGSGQADAGLPAAGRRAPGRLVARQGPAALPDGPGLRGARRGRLAHRFAQLGLLFAGFAVLNELVRWRYNTVNGVSAPGWRSSCGCSCRFRWSLPWPTCPTCCATGWMARNRRTILTKRGDSGGICRDKLAASPLACQKVPRCPGPCRAPTAIGETNGQIFGNLNLVLATGLALAIGVMLCYAEITPINVNNVFHWLHVFFRHPCGSGCSII